ncbi:hypothetical protein [Confluentibacter sediminis]|uniref:hypothetical protein n=1 Tax=Confluentibacter sediminis TaxID=2219045 RepID=UPI000DAB535F|nr:hypothetical protein [Confluentibacter sediminis]
MKESLSFLNQSLHQKNTVFNKKTTVISQLINLLTGSTMVGEYYPKNKGNGLRSKTGGGKSRSQELSLLEKWQSLFDIQHWTITYESIDEMQVLDDLKGDMPGHEFVGIAIDFANKTGVIYHTRPLQEDDIIHELLHVRFPDWSEQKVNYWTNLLINQPKKDMSKMST